MKLRRGLELLAAGCAPRVLVLLAGLPALAAAQAVISSVPLPSAFLDGWGLTRLSWIGDVNGDGRADFVVSAPNATDLGFGVVQVRSSADGSVLREWTGTVPLGRFGISIDSTGDMDGDGVAEVVIGAPGPSWDAAYNGEVTVRSPVTGLVLSGSVGTASHDGFGLEVAGLGDLDGDGVGDYAASAPEEHAGSPTLKPGYVRVISGASSAILATLKGSFNGQHFGTGLRCAGDLNGDGVPDLALLLRTSSPSVDLGVRVYSGAWIAHGIPPEIILELPASAADFAVDGPGDVDGDGFGDLLVGTPYAGAALLAGGFVVVSGQDASTLLTYAGTTVGQQLGVYVSDAGDLDGDGTPDLLAAGGHESLLDVEGRAVAVSGRDGTELGAVTGPGEIFGGYFGSGLAGLGDVNGDGRPDWGLSGTGYGDVALLSQVGLWTDAGHGLAGSHGVPQLTGTGVLLGDTPVSLQLQGALPSSPAVLVLGSVAVSLPFKGGVFVPDAGLLVPMQTGALGELTTAGTLPAGTPAMDLWFQVWQLDAAGPLGYAASNALRAQVP